MRIYIYDSVYTSLITYCQIFAPSGVTVVSGEGYGVRFLDPSGANPSLSVEVQDMTDHAFELGSGGAIFVCSITINAASRLQRDALKSIVFENIANAVVPIYTNVDAGDVSLVQYASIRPGVKIQDIPNFSSNREQFYWTSFCFFTLEALI